MAQTANLRRLNNSRRYIELDAENELVSFRHVRGDLFRCIFVPIRAGVRIAFQH